MCLALYMAAAKPLPLIPWDAAHPGFHVTELSADAAGVRRHFNKPFMFYAGAHEGCACAFNYGREYPDFEDDPADLAAAQNDIASLSRYLTEAASDGSSIELFSCYFGDEAKDSQHARVCFARTIADPDFYFHDREFLLVNKVA